MMSTQTVQTRSTSRYEGMQATGRERDGTKAEQEAVTATTEKWFPFYYINFFSKILFFTIERLENIYNLPLIK